MTKQKYARLVAEHGEREVAGNIVFPVKLTGKNQQETDLALSAALAKKRRAFSDEEKLKSTLLQLRFQIEDYLKGAHFDKRKTFGYFLKSYIENLKRKHNEFARDINITSAQLSQYINNHRAPTTNVIIRLELHSHNIISAVYWYQLLEMQNLHELKTNKNLRKEQKQFMKKEAELA